ncbi:BPSS1780 family membrane protein [Massilia sp. W12]|uniref:BPSS1780 family membrane protein n=1 Tax=Massilia sp. W12 TaxID=3126507 RepID=UPI0030CC34E6
MAKAGDGVQWILQGLQLLRKRPAELMSLSLLWMALAFICAMLGDFGALLWQLATPALCFIMLQACHNIDSGKKQDWNSLLQTVRAPLLKPMLLLGLFWVAAALLAGAILVLQLGQETIQSLSNPANQNKLPPGFDSAHFLQSVLLSLLLLCPFFMALWFTPGLVGWRRMGVAQALFFSMVSVWRALGAFLLYGLGMFLSLILFTFAMQPPLMLAQALFGNVGVSMILLASGNLFFALAFASMYCCYRQFFGMPEAMPPATE